VASSVEPTWKASIETKAFVPADEPFSPRTTIWIVCGPEASPLNVRGTR
jgi:hypothetical protein